VGWGLVAIAYPLVVVGFFISTSPAIWYFLLDHLASHSPQDLFWILMIIPSLGALTGANVLGLLAGRERSLQGWLLWGLSLLMAIPVFLVGVMAGMG